MSILRTSFRTIYFTWPLFLCLAALMALLEYFFPEANNIGGQMVVYSIVVYFTHRVILTGHFDFWGRDKGNQAQSAFSLSFFGLVFLVVWLPVFAGIIFVAVSLGDAAIDRTPLYIGVGFVPFWLSLTFFGFFIPRYVWIELTGDNTVKGLKRRGVAVFVGTRLLFWNVAYFIFFLATAFTLGALSNSSLGSALPFFDLGMNVVLEALSYIAVVLTAAILSHACLKAYDLGPQGLIDTP